MSDNQIYIRYRVKELVQQLGYIVRQKNILLAPLAQQTIQGGTDIYLLVDNIENIKIESENGIYEIGTYLTNQQVIEHSGTITITNNSTQTLLIPFIQLTFKNTYHVKTN